jgi:mannose-6-phosphate isomerase-like protein (cupin superfamily)
MGKPVCGRQSAEFPGWETLEREWGTEKVFLVPGLYTLKQITVFQGKEGGLQYHRIKDEAGYVVSGAMSITYEESPDVLHTKVVRPGDIFHFPACSVHKALALTDCVYIEVSNPVFNDRVHVEDHYGEKEEKGGLPSTKPWEIIQK